MDILAARKRAAELAKKKKTGPPRPATPAEPAAPPPDASADVPASGPPVAVDSPEQTQVREAPEAVEALVDEREEDLLDDEEMSEPEAPELESLAFRLGTEEYLVMVEQVREVLSLRDTTPVPHAPEYIPGVITLRGTVLPVIDLAKRLGLAAGVRDERSRIMVVSLEDEDAGLIVDRVTSVVRFREDEVQPAPDTVEQGAGAEFLKGIVRKDGKLFILLDLEKAAGA